MPFVTQFFKRLVSTWDAVKVIATALGAISTTYLFLVDIHPCLPWICLIAVMEIVLLLTLRDMRLRPDPIVMGPGMHERELKRKETERKVHRTTRSSIALTVIAVAGVWSVCWYSSQCRQNPQVKVSLLTASFGDGDQFGKTLAEKFAEDFMSTDTVATKYIAEHISITESSGYDNLPNVMSQKCGLPGLLVFGTRIKDDPAFACKVYIGYEPLRVRHGNVTNIPNPQVEFTIGNHVDAVSKFVEGILFSQSAATAAIARELLNEAMYRASLENQPSGWRPLMARAPQPSDSHSGFRAWCSFFVGNSYLAEGNLVDAAKAYMFSTDLDSTNGYTHYNLAYTMLLRGDTSFAAREFLAARSIDIDPPLLIERPVWTEVDRQPLTVKAPSSSLPDVTMKTNEDNLVGLSTGSGETILPSVYKDLHGVLTSRRWNADVLFGTKTSGEKELILVDWKHSETRFYDVGDTIPSISQIEEIYLSRNIHPVKGKYTLIIPDTKFKSAPFEFITPYATKNPGPFADYFILFDGVNYGAVDAAGKRALDQEYRSIIDVKMALEKDPI